MDCDSVHGNCIDDGAPDSLHGVVLLSGSVEPLL